MKRAASLLMLAVMAMAYLLMSAPVSHAFDCARKGDTMSMVLRNCGEPTWVDTGEERRWVAVPIGAILDGWYVTKDPGVVLVVVKIEEWTYDLGRNKFMRILRFEDGVLVSIATGRYGRR